MFEIQYRYMLHDHVHPDYLKTWEFTNELYLMEPSFFLLNEA
jgi:hypothetical protein